MSTKAERMKASEYIETLDELGARVLLRHLRQKFAWYVEIFDHDDGTEWLRDWTDSPEATMDPELWEKIVNSCNNWSERAATESVWEAFSQACDDAGIE